MVEQSLFLCVLCRCSTRCLSLDGCIACSWSCTRSSSVAFESFYASARSKIFTMALLQTWRFHDLIPWCQQKPALRDCCRHPLTVVAHELGFAFIEFCYQILQAFPNCQHSQHIKLQQWKEWREEKNTKIHNRKTIWKANHTPAKWRSATLIDSKTWFRIKIGS